MVIYCPQRKFPKVMFSKVSVCLHGRGGVHGKGGHAWWGACVAGETAIAEGGTHPTGMHSCYQLNLIITLNTTTLHLI